jgi:hypothetical protein
MATNGLAQFDKQSYLNIETYRKSGEAVRTPVWFSQQNDGLYVWTSAASGKVKRIRNNSHVRIVPCTARGEPRGEWVDATATVLDGDGDRARDMMRAKYGLTMRLFEVMGRVQRAFGGGGGGDGAGNTAIRITLA